MKVSDSLTGLERCVGGLGHKSKRLFNGFRKVCRWLNHEG